MFSCEGAALRGLPLMRASMALKQKCSGPAAESAGHLSGRDRASRRPTQKGRCEFEDLTGRRSELSMAGLAAPHSDVLASGRSAP